MPATRVRKAASGAPGAASAREQEDLHGSAAVRARVDAVLAGADGDVSLDVGGEAFGVSHLDRVYWPAEPRLDQPAVTKRDYLRYLLAFAPSILPHIARRPLTLFRWPEGVAGRRVLMKHWEIRLPAFVHRVEIFSESKGRPDQYVLCDNLATLLWLGHMGTLEFHAWHSRVQPGPDAERAGVDFTSSLAALQSSVVERPDYLLFDIDPFFYTGRETRAKQPEFSEQAFERSREVAFWLKQLLDAMRLTSFVKTSGKTGLHVVVPIRRTLPYAAVREVARTIGDHLMRAHRESITVDWSVDKRTGKVFIDYNMNVRAKSMPVPYSPRGLAGAPVSMPLTWQALRSAHPLDYRIGTLLARRTRKRDPWAALHGAKQDLAERLSAG